MATLLKKAVPDNLGELLARLGNIPAERMLLYPNPETAKEKERIK